jgi:flagellar motor protein MotB
MWIRRQQPNEADDSSADVDGGYIASASDLMIGLLFVFIILVVVLALEQRRQQQAFDDQVAGVVGAGDPLIVVTGTIGQALKKALPNVRVDPKTGVISLPEDALFARGSAQLSESGRQVLASAAEQLAEAMPCFVDNQRAKRSCPGNPYGHEIETVFIEGHTDSVPFASGGRDNFDLSLARARAVEMAMVLNSPLVEFRNKAGQQVFSFSAYADKRPLPNTDPTDGVNRRVDLRIVLSYKPIEELIRSLKGTPGAGRP